MDQYTLTLELLKSEAEQEYHSNEEQINEPIPEEADVKHTQDQKVKENDDTEEPEEIDPVYVMFNNLLNLKLLISFKMKYTVIHCYVLRNGSLSSLPDLHLFGCQYPE